MTANSATSTGTGSHRPKKVLITGGHELGGVRSVAVGLAQGFAELGCLAEVIPASRILCHWNDLRNADVLKILSTTAVFAAPLARRAMCIAHGIPCADVQGWAKLSAIIASYKLANICGAQLVAVSDYTAIHLQTIFNVRIDAVIRNPLKPLFLEPFDRESQERRYITYVGRLHPAKNLHRILPAICDLLNERADLRACIVGDGELRAALEKSVQGNPRVEFKGSPDDSSVREWLRHTKVFVSGNATEGLGVTYLEALSQGCVVAMPASGGGLELGLDQIGSGVYLFPVSLDREAVLNALRQATRSSSVSMPLVAYEPSGVAAAYLDIDSRRHSRDRRSVQDRTSNLDLPE